MPSVTRRSTRSTERREAVIAEVAAAVARLLAEGHGYTGLGVGRIADEAGIARSTFYLYFPDKVALIMRVTEAATDDLFAAASAWVADGFDDRAQLEQTLAGVLAQRRAHALLIDALAEVAAYEEDVAAFWRARIGGFVEVLERRIAQDQRAGTVDAVLDPAATAAWIAWGVERLIGQHVAADDGAGDEQLVRGVATAIWAMLGRP